MQARESRVRVVPDQGTICAVNWAAYGLENPADDERACPEDARYRVIQSCENGHLSKSPACGVHVTIMRSYGPLEEYQCEGCRVAGLDVIAPVTVTEWPPV